MTACSPPRPSPGLLPEDGGRLQPGALLALVDQAALQRTAPAASGAHRRRCTGPHRARCTAAAPARRRCGAPGAHRRRTRRRTAPARRPAVRPPGDAPPRRRHPEGRPARPARRLGTPGTASRRRRSGPAAPRPPPRRHRPRQPSSSTPTRTTTLSPPRPTDRPDDQQRSDTRRHLNEIQPPERIRTCNSSTPERLKSTRTQAFKTRYTPRHHDQMGRAARLRGEGAAGAGWPARADHLERSQRVLSDRCGGRGAGELLHRRRDGGGAARPLVRRRGGHPGTGRRGRHRRT